MKDMKHNPEEMYKDDVVGHRSQCPEVVVKKKGTRNKMADKSKNNPKYGVEGV